MDQIKAGAFLKDLRREKGITQEQLAEELGILVSRYYFSHVKYICSECHEVFKPTLKEAFWANHTPTTRKLTCTQCGHKGFCVEVWGGDGKWQRF